MKLPAAILPSSNQGMKTDQIAREINERGLFQRWDKEPEYQRIDDMCRARRFIEEQTWKFAKTMPQIPHYYCLKGLCSDPGEFEWFVGYLLEHSVSGEFYGKTYRYFYLDNWKYWIMDKGPEDCNLINREDQTGRRV